ncbi:chemotaxis protein [Pseudomonas cremoricolorata]|uniref:Chemotaxis protein n=2 Tax=Pseudomonas cremoricolorata TaxID=157783 RepID=A0A089WQK4_9PSED|nr:methyl-accepting chemotaxis protein [Pseudomonas cremoricolorata]AIR90856.1 chemotaxis protein [Pseudomonas cremoricolorata]
MSIRRLNIAPRALLGFSLIGVLMLALGIFSLVQMGDIRQAGVKIETVGVPSIKALNELTTANLRLRTLTYTLLANRDPQSQAETLRRMDERNAQTDKARQTYQNLVEAQNEQVIFDHFGQLLGEYRQLEARVRELSSANRLDELRALLNGDMLKNSEAINQVMGELVQFNTDQARKSNDAAQNSYDSAITLVIALLIVATLLTFIFAFVLTRSIVKPVEDALRTAEQIAVGDLTHRIETDGTDEAARLLQAMASMQARLRETLQQIAGSATQLASAAEELNSVTDEGARGLAQQNAEIQQAATAVTEMTSAVEEVARNAVSTSQASAEASRSAGDGRDLVLETVSAIERMSGDVQATGKLVEDLAGQSRDIGKVLDVIRGLADQTNLLALNAAIEAARAGEAGRGFAVVADEVRALAHRTQQSTSDIERMIGSIQGGTEHAVESMRTSTERAESTLNMARGAGLALDTIAGAVSQINERNLVIASAAEEQAQVAREVDRNLVNINDLSVQSAAGAHQTTAASAELSRLAVDLNTMVGRFRT